MEKQTQQNSSLTPIRKPKAKLKRKLDEGNNSYELLLCFLKESAATSEQGYRVAQIRIQIEAKKLALKEMEVENKILLTSLSSIGDNNIREYIRSEQARIIQKRKEQQQHPPTSPICSCTFKFS